MKKILITGANGYIGGYLQNSLREYHHIIAVDIQDIVKEDYFICNLTDKQGVSNLIDKVLPDIIIHCAGTKDLFDCEKDPDKAYKLNVDTTKNLVDVVMDKDMKFIFLSSDYVFGGDRGNYKEEDIPDPKTVYGKTKLLCENYIMRLSNYAICRTANVYGMGSKFFDFVLESLKNNKTLEMYEDAYFSPTYIGNLSDMIIEIIRKDLKRILHTAGAERINRHEFALKIAKHFNLNNELIKPSKKPKDSPIAYDSSLDVSETIRKLGIRFINVDEGLEYIGGL